MKQGQELQSDDTNKWRAKREQFVFYPEREVLDLVKYYAKRNEISRSEAINRLIRMAISRVRARAKHRLSGKERKGKGDASGK